MITGFYTTIFTDYSCVPYMYTGQIINVGGLPCMETIVKHEPVLFTYGLN